jgi:hypothetical protein
MKIQQKRQNVKQSDRKLNQTWVHNIPLETN